MKPIVSIILTVVVLAMLVCAASPLICWKVSRDYRIVRAYCWSNEFKGELVATETEVWPTTEAWPTIEPTAEPTDELPVPYPVQETPGPTETVGPYPAPMETQAPYPWDGFEPEH